MPKMPKEIFFGKVFGLWSKTRFCFNNAWKLDAKICIYKFFYYVWQKFFYWFTQCSRFSLVVPLFLRLSFAAMLPSPVQAASTPSTTTKASATLEMWAVIPSLWILKNPEIPQKGKILFFCYWCLDSCSVVWDMPMKYILWLLSLESGLSSSATPFGSASRRWRSGWIEVSLLIRFF